MLEPLGALAQDSVAHEHWRALVTEMQAALGWACAPAIVRAHAGGAFLVISAPFDALFTATEINEWAWEQASGNFDGGALPSPFDQLHAIGHTVTEALAVFRARCAIERGSGLGALGVLALQHQLPLLVDDDAVSIGAGAGSRTWLRAALPEPANIPWDAFHDIPTALVTGANGKTTTVRLLAAMLDASPGYGGRVGYSSTEGVMIGGVPGGEGDYAGPAGARVVLRDTRVAAAVLETARGGILRRGLAVAHANVAIVTNITADHFGEYGIDTLDDLAETKLAVAHALGINDTLVLNADDTALLARAAAQTCKVALFAADDACPALQDHRAAGGATCGVRENRLWLTYGGEQSDLGDIREMPLTLAGHAKFNIGNIAASALAAAAMGVSTNVIAETLARFGNARSDNPGRLERWQLADITVLIDYAHNPDGLQLLLASAHAIHPRTPGSRLGLLLGQAGNRTDSAIAELARIAAAFVPARIVIKEIASMLRGRKPGDVPARLKSALIEANYPPENIAVEAEEFEAARSLLRWAGADDLIVLPVHQRAAREALAALLTAMARADWRAGAPLP